MSLTFSHCMPLASFRSVSALASPIIGMQDVTEYVSCNFFSTSLIEGPLPRISVPALASFISGLHVTQ